MSSDWNQHSDQLLAARRKSVEKSIKPIGVDALKELGEKLFPQADDPWRKSYFEFLRDNPAERYYHATAMNRVEVIYCPAKETGIWFIPGKGRGVLQPKALKVLAEVLKKR
jgi:hypothetical protein